MRTQNARRIRCWLCDPGVVETACNVEVTVVSVTPGRDNGPNQRVNRMSGGCAGTGYVGDGAAATSSCWATNVTTAGVADGRIASLSATTRAAVTIIGIDNELKARTLSPRDVLGNANGDVRRSTLVR